MSYLKRIKANISLSLLLLLLTSVMASCSYSDRVAPIKLPETATGMVEINGLKIAATAFVDRDEASSAYGFDIRKAGILPVQITFQHDGSQPVMINPTQTFLLDHANNAWPLLSTEKMYQRTSKYVKIGETVKGAATPSFLMGAAGAVAGLAIGIVSGNNIGESMGQGAVLGAAGGAIIGGAEGAATSNRTVREDLAEKSLRNKPIQPGQIAYGTLFFPGTYNSEAQSARQLRLSLSFGQHTEEVVTIYLGAVMK